MHLQYLDQKRIDFLSSLVDEEDPDFFKSYLQVFLSHSKDLITQLNDMIETGSNKAEISKCSHAMKGTCQNIGANSLAKELLVIEESAEQLEYEKLRDLVNEINRRYQDVIHEVNLLLASKL